MLPAALNACSKPIAKILLRSRRGGPEQVSEEWGHQSDQRDVKRQTCAPLVRKHWRPIRRVLSLFSSHGERVDVRDVRRHGVGSA